MAIVAFVFFVVLVRLVDLQLIRGDSFRMEYEKLLRSVSSLPAVRGRILDRKGYILAMDEPSFDFCLQYKFLSNNEKWRTQQIKKIAKKNKISEARAEKVFDHQSKKTWQLAYHAAVDVRKKELGTDNLPPAELEDVKKELERNVSRLVKRVTRIRKNVGVPIRMENESYPIVSAMNEQQAVRYRSHIEKALGASIRPGSIRRYPYNDIACHIIGFTSPVDDQDLKKHNLKGDGYSWFVRNEKDYHFDDWIGRAGVERMCEPLLRGMRGYTLKKKPGEIQKNPPRNGRDVQLTIDINLQREVAKLFNNVQGKKVRGSAVIMSIPDREILAMVSVPTYNLNRYRREYSKLVGDGLYLPLLHRAVRRLYPPGSTAKPLAALAGLHHGVIHTGTTIYCSGSLIPGKQSFRCWNRYGHKDLNLYESLQRSCNIYYYKTGQRLGLDRLNDWYRMLEFENKAGCGLVEEAAGVLPKQDGRQDVGEARLLAIGQGPIGVTPLHVANATASIAAGGKFRSPVLVKQAGELPNPPKVIKRNLPVTTSQVDAVHQGMYMAINETGGTLFKEFNKNRPNIVSCGKSGTAQTVPHSADMNGDGRIDSHERLTGDMAWSIAFAPRHDPKIAIVAVVEYTILHGGDAAGPIVRDSIILCEGFGYFND